MARLPYVAAARGDEMGTDRSSAGAPLLTNRGMVTLTDTAPAAQRPASPAGRESGAAIRGIPEFFVVRSGLDQGHAGFTVGPGAVTLAPWSPPSI